MTVLLLLIKKPMNKRTLLVGISSIIAMVLMVSGVQAVSSHFANNNLKLYGRAFNPTGSFTIDDNTVISRNAFIDGSAEVKGELYNSTGVVKVNDDLNVTGVFSINSMVTPTTATCTQKGAMSFDSTYLYLCTGTTWKKVALQAL